MADTKITALTAITSITPATFPLPIVDLLDTTMAGSGTTKKVTVNQILGCGGTATLASATITGDLTVDTSTLKVDSANDRVGVGITSPLAKLDVRQIAAAEGLKVYVNDTGATNIINFRSYDNTLGEVTRYAVACNGVATWSNVGGVAGTAMTLNATGLGVGGSPNYKLDVNGVARVSSGGDGVFLSSAPSPDLYVVGVNYYNNNGTEGVQVSARPSWKIEHKNSNDALAYLDIGFRAASAAASAFTSRFKIDGSGNVGIGVTPSAKFDVGLTGAGTPRIRFTSASDDPILEFQRYSGVASDYYGERILTGGGFYFQTAPAAAVGSQTFTTRMSLDASGRLILLASTTTPATLSTNGQLTMTATSDTNLRFSYRGSDGVTRVANLTLA